MFCTTELAPGNGVTAVTVGARVAPPTPRIESLPPLQPAISRLETSAMHKVEHWEAILIVRIKVILS